MFGTLRQKEFNRIASGEPTRKDVDKVFKWQNVKAAGALIANEQTSSEILEVLIKAYKGSVGVKGMPNIFPGLRYGENVNKLFEHANLSFMQVNTLFDVAFDVDVMHVETLLVKHSQAFESFESNLLAKLSASNGKFGRKPQYSDLFLLKNLREENYCSLIKSTNFVSPEIKLNCFKKLLSNPYLPTTVLNRLRNETDDLKILKLIGLHQNTSLLLIKSLPNILQKVCLDDYDLRRENKSINLNSLSNEFNFVVEPETEEELALSEKRKSELKATNKRFLESKSLATTLINGLRNDLPLSIKTQFDVATNELDTTLSFYKDICNGPLTSQGEEAYEVAVTKIENSLTNYESVISSFINLMKLSENEKKVMSQSDNLRIDAKAWSDIKVFESKL